MFHREFKKRRLRNYLAHCNVQRIKKSPAHSKCSVSTSYHYFHFVEQKSQVERVSATYPVPQVHGPSPLEVCCVAPGCTCQSVQGKWPGGLVSVETRGSCRKSCRTKSSSFWGDKWVSPPVLKLFMVPARPEMKCDCPESTCVFIAQGIVTTLRTSQPDIGTRAQQGTQEPGGKETSPRKEEIHWAAQGLQDSLGTNFRTKPQGQVSRTLPYQTQSQGQRQRKSSYLRD